MSHRKFIDELIEANQGAFINELVKQRGVKKETAIQILNMESSLRHEILIALRDSYQKGKSENR